MKGGLVVLLLVAIVAVWCVGSGRATMPKAAAAAGGGRMAREFEDRGTLWVGRPKRGEQLELGGHKGVSYHIAGLRPGASYEARLSYPAFVPYPPIIYFILFYFIPFSFVIFIYNFIDSFI